MVLLSSNENGLYALLNVRFFVRHCVHLYIISGGIVYMNAQLLRACGVL